MANTDLEQRIKEAAAKATPGEWHVCGASGGACSCRLIWSTVADGVVAKAGCAEDAPEEEKEGFTVEQAAFNQAYIALASPANILALLAEKDAEIERLKAGVKGLQEELKEAAAEARWAERQGEDYGSY